jgi:molybdenum cofactor guanylyltransferase
MSNGVPLELGGYVLAGGRSSRMGRDKALIELAGKPLIEHAVKKLRRVCRSVCILGTNPALKRYAPLVPDIHPDCGPIGGMEAALTHSLYDWNVFLAVDMPFLPAGFICNWTAAWLKPEMERDFGPGIRMFSSDGRPQPGFCLIHKEVGPFLSEAIERREFKLMKVFEAAGMELGLRRGSRLTGLWNVPATGLESPIVAEATFSARDWRRITDAQRAAQFLWFANLNTPEEFAVAEAHSDALDA